MPLATRHDVFIRFFPQAPAFRWRQIEREFFAVPKKTWAHLLTLPREMRTQLAVRVPWVSYTQSEVFSSKKKDTYKAVLTLVDGARVETVLMANARDQWTICVSSQVGCAMACTFCATGKMGFTRNLSSDEIVDQYRFWRYYLAQHPDLPKRISNVVFMGMGEPMANYDQVKRAVQTWLEFTDLGRTRITVSTVGFLPRLEKLIDDPDWPHVRLAVSLHSADGTTRKEIVPTSYDDFLARLRTWAQNYLKKYGQGRHHLTFEYVMLSDVNDTDMHAKKLARFVNQIGKVRVNLIPYNFTDGKFAKSRETQIIAFKKILEDAGVTVTVRKTMGDDIAAACGQLITQKS
ncbi:MAG: hypothetical protein A3F54_02230 [Candidatus Kerfeldbacteria bacterium RIFCSPHIGHO2_12_FULL_48_17]|uniref:Radical SAM core domain-containing protein n=1 Tax=Candidatus Kerfeldbacteria bacterium RIFCSPHIGHO2_12_FULL_48_17 TaxID=1798542 RepID=A0A1G2B055_9BACT|nr:MAG: hypothetical protein A3F54_02230 [Candidatus Kerfeldbacteria bacterium RIFCSPHIGHO2_12_FULL_48_17]